MKNLVIIGAALVGFTSALFAVEKGDLRAAIVSSNLVDVRSSLEFREEFSVVDLKMYHQLAQEVVSEREKLVLTEADGGNVGKHLALGAVTGYLFLPPLILIFADYAFSAWRAPLKRLTSAKAILFALERAVAKRQKSAAKL